MAASGPLLLRISEYLRARKSAIASDAAAGCRDGAPSRPDAEAGFPWEEKLPALVQGASEVLLARSNAPEDAPPVPAKAPAGAAGGIRDTLAEAWAVRAAFLRALNRFQGEQSGRKVDFTAIEMTEARQEAVLEFDQQLSAALAAWIATSSSNASVPTSSVRDLYDGIRAVQGLLQMAAGNGPAKGHVAAAAQQLNRLAASTLELIESAQHPEQPRTSIAPPKPAVLRHQGVLALAPLDVASFVHALAEAARPAAQKRGLGVTSLCNPGPAIIKTDSAKLHRAATLLIDYGIGFTDHGEISIVSGVNEAQEWTMEISDSSAGVPPDILARLLKGVAHAPDDPSAVKDPGLGIALARDLIQLLGGHLEAASEPAEGNRFTIILPPE